MVAGILTLWVAALCILIATGGSRGLRACSEEEAMPTLMDMSSMEELLGSFDSSPLIVCSVREKERLASENDVMVKDK